MTFFDLLHNVEPLVILVGVVYFVFERYKATKDNEKGLEKLTSTVEKLSGTVTSLDKTVAVLQIQVNLMAKEKEA